MTTIEDHSLARVHGAGRVLLFEPEIWQTAKQYFKGGPIEYGWNLVWENLSKGHLPPPRGHADGMRRGFWGIAHPDAILIRFSRY